MSTDQNVVTEADVYKAIGHLEEATKKMSADAVVGAENEEAIVGFFTIIGQVIKQIFLR